MTIESFRVLEDSSAPRRRWRPEPAPRSVRIGERAVGEGQPCWVIAESGINHNGSLELARRLIEGAKRAGCDAVKFQKREPELCVPQHERGKEPDTPWGRMTHLDYERKIGFGEPEYRQIDARCRELDLAWFASCWEEPSVDFLERFEPPCYEAASASPTDHALLRKMRATGRPLVISTGMSTWREIEDAVHAPGTNDLLTAHSTSAYPCNVEELHLRVISTLRAAFPACPIGYSGHETGLAPTWAAVALGATFVERHVTLDRALWGTDQAASVEVHGMERLVAQIRDIQRALGDGVKRIYDSELPVRAKLRPVGAE